MSDTRISTVMQSGDPRGFPPIGRPGLPSLPPFGSLPGHPDNLIFGANRSSASPFGAAPSTNALIAARFAPAVRLNPLSLRGPVTNGDSGWLMLTIDRPSFVWPTGYMNNGTTLNVPAYEVLYAPIQRPLNDSQALRSARRGIAYLSNPGAWWIKYNAPDAAAAATLECIVIDANDPAVAGRYLSEPGCNGFTTGTVVLPATGGTALQIVAANPYRKGLTIQNVTTGAGGCRVGIGGVALDWATIGGFVLSAGTVPGTLTMAGDTLALSACFGIGTSATAPTVFFTEYF